MKKEIIFCRDAKNKRWVKRVGERVDMPHLWPFKFYICRGLDRYHPWSITELTTGSKVDWGYTKKEAMEDGIESLIRRQHQEVQRAVEKFMDEIYDGGK